ncbi:MAG: S9 family peptidase [Vicinamibacterales bacterium]
MPFRIRIAGFLITILMTAPAVAQQRFTLELVRNVVAVGSPRISPDGRTVAIVVTRSNYTDNRNESELYAVDVATGASRPLTFERRAVAEPRWSPDGRTLAFLAPDASDRQQVWLLPTQGGEARRLTQSPTGVQHYAWRPDGQGIAFAADDEAPKLEGEARHVGAFRVGDQDLFLRERVRPQHIWLQMLGDAEAKPLTSGEWSLEFVLPPGSPPSRLSWSPDGKRIAFARVPVPESGKLDFVSVWVLDVATGKLTSLTGADQFQNNPTFSPDGAAITYWYPRDGRYDLNWVNEIYIAAAAGGAGRSLTRAIDRNLYAAEWMPGGKELVVAGNDKATVGVWVQPVDGSATQIDLGDLVVSGAYGYELTVSKSGAIFFVATTAGRPPELYLMEKPSWKPRRLTDFNQWAGSVSWAPMERVTWKGPDGFDEDGVLVLPPDFSPSMSYPLVLNIHGGPTAASKVSFNALAQLMAAEGWVVFMPNYRGSDNLGNAYFSAILGDWGRGPGRDVMAGIAEVRKRRHIDPRRTAVTGWSYGGYMTTWLLGNYPDEWKVGMAGAPVTSFADEYNLSDGNVIWRYLFGGSPWNDTFAEKYREQSPITYATKIKAPTLIMSNMEDFRVPPTQALALYHALKDSGVETEFIGFRGRTHASSDPVNARERMRLWIDWVKRHIGSGPSTVVRR